MSPSLEQLVQISIAKRYHPITFGKLFAQYKQRATTESDDVKIDLIPLFQGCSKSLLQLKYIFEVLVKDDLNNTYEELSELFRTYMTQLDQDDQVAIILYFNQIAQEFPWTSVSSSELFVSAFEEYLSNFTTTDHDNMVLPLTKFVVNLLGGGLNVGTTVKYQSCLKEKHLDAAYGYLTNYIARSNLMSVKKDFQSLTGSTFGVQSSADTSRLLKLKKILWLSQQFTVNFAPVSDKLIRAFKGLLNLSRVATSDTNTSIAYELTVSLFQCLQLSTFRTRHIWVHAISYKLAHILQKLKISQAKLASTLRNAFDAIGLDDENKPVIEKLVNNLVTMGLVKPSQFTKIQVEEPTVTVDIRDKYQSIFHENSPEFISMEESGMSEFIKSIDSSLAAKEQFAKLFNESVKSFIENRETLLLRRLLLSLTINKDILDYVLLQESPYRLIKPLVRFLDKHIEEKPDSPTASDMMDIDSDDASNAQAFFTDYGTVLIFLQYAVFRYNMNLWKFNEQEHTQQLLNGASILTCPEYMVQVQDPDSDINSVIGSWITSLFDNTNTDGISDELVQKSSLRDYHFVMPCIVTESLTAFNLSLIDEESLVGGLEYLYGPFLIHTLVAVFRRLLNDSWPLDDKQQSSTLIAVFEKLSVLNESDLSDETCLLHLMVLEVMNEELYDYFENVPAAQSYLSKLQKPEPIAGDLQKLVSLIFDGTPTKFDLVSVFTRADSSQCGIDWFYDQLVSLLAQKSGTFVEVLDYELIATLIIYYSSTKTRSSLKPWIDQLTAFTSGNQVTTADRPGVEELVVVDKAQEKRKLTEKEAEESGLESNFLGFIQEPKEEDEPATEQPQAQHSGQSGESVDLYVSNLLVIGNYGDEKVARGLMNRILSNLNCIY